MRITPHGRRVFTQTTRRAIGSAALLLMAAMLPACSGGDSTARPRTAVTPSPGLAPVSRPAAAEYGVVSRELTVLERAPIDEIYDAAQRAMSDLQLRVVDRTKDRLSASLAARTAHDERVTIGLGRVSSGITDVSIKVGFWGDEGKSRAILSEIRRQLAMSAGPSGSPGLDADAAIPGPYEPDASVEDAAVPTLASNVAAPPPRGAAKPASSTKREPASRSAPARGTNPR